MKYLSHSKGWGKTMYIDTHCHLHHRKFNKDRKQILEQMKICGIEAFIEVPIEFNSNYDMREKIPQGHFAVGVHPSKVMLMEQEDSLQHLKRLAVMQNTVAVGETGLDTRTVEHEIQEKYLRTFIQIALEYDKPLILHLRGEGTYQRAFEILQEYGCIFRGVLHCFTGDVKDAFRFIELGFHLGIGGLVTYKENVELRSAVKEIPSEKILLETDSPFLRPKTCLEGNRNSPLNILSIATEIANIKGIETQRVADITTGNARELFRL